MSGERLTPGRRALIEAAQLETARIYATTVREEDRRFARELAEYDNAPEVVARRRAIAESMNDSPALRVVS